MTDKHQETRPPQHRSRSHHRPRRRKPSTPDNDATNYGHPTSDLAPDAAFRESLFDALGDDEGAAYWQGVYGQPIHTYAKTVRNEETGELETMSDEEYACFVRRKMWEKSWEGIEAAKEKKRREQVEKKRQTTAPLNEESSFQYDTQNFVFNLEIENSLKRGVERKTKKRWKSVWEAYTRQWEELHALRESWKHDREGSDQLCLRNKIAWPVESGKRRDVNTEKVERFIHECSASIRPAEGEDPLQPILRAERIRFHPDKIQQRFSFMDVDTDTMKGVTEVFQILDRMWTMLRSHQT